MDAHYIPLSNGIVEFNYILTDFLPAGSVHFWERAVAVSNCNGVLICFSLQFYQFCLLNKVAGSLMARILLKNLSGISSYFFCPHPKANCSGELIPNWLRQCVD